MSTDRLKKMRYIHTGEYYSATKKNEILPFAATWMDIILSEVSQTEKENYCMISLICGLQNRKQTNQDNGIGNKHAAARGEKE